MDQSDDDLRMIDQSEETLSKDIFSTSRDTLTRPLQRPMFDPLPSTSSSKPDVQNGFMDIQDHVMPSSDNELQAPLSQHAKGRSRESSVLARDVAHHLSIDHQQNGNQDQLNRYLYELESEEQEPVAPLRSSLPSGFCYDVRMRYHYELDPPKDRRDYHPEDPRRIFAIYRELCLAGLIKDPLLNNGTIIPNPMRHIEAREVTEAEVTLVHDKKHFDSMSATSSRSSRPFHLDLG